MIDQTYCPWGSCNKGSSSHVEVRGVEFISISGQSESKVAVEHNCSKDVPCRDVEMGDIYLEYQGEGHRRLVQMSMARHTDSWFHLTVISIHSESADQMI